MTARSFDGTDDEIRTSIGNCNITGAVSMGAIFRRSANGDYHAIMGLHTSGGTATYSIEVADTNVFDFTGNVNFGGHGIVAADGWTLVLFTKATGTVAPRLHRYVYSTKAWTHFTASTSTANGSSVSGGTVRFGEWQDVDDFAGLIDRAAIWDKELTDAEAELLTGGLGSWFYSNPKGLWDFRQAATGQGVRDLTGGGADQSTIAGTTVDKDQSFQEPGWGQAGIINLIASAGGTTFTQDVSGTLASAGALIRQTNKALAAPLAPTGIVVRLTLKNLAGTLASTGNVVRLTSRTLTGTLASTATLATTRAIILSLSGPLASTGALVRQTNKSLVGVLASTATLSKQVNQSLSGTLASAGTIVRKTNKNLAGTLALAATLATEEVSGLYELALAGTLALSATLARQGNKLFTGTLASAGTLVSTQVNKNLAGTLASTGVLATLKVAVQPLSGTLATAGTLSRLTLQNLAGNPVFFATLTREARRTLTGTLALHATLRRRPNISMSGIISSIVGAASHVLVQVEFFRSPARYVASERAMATYTADDSLGEEE